MDTNKTYREEYWKMAGNNEFFEALTMLEHERGITAEYLIEKIRAAIVIAVKKNYDVEDDNVSVEIDPATGVFNVALVQDVVADEDWENEHTQIPLSKAQTLRRTYQPGDRVVTPLKTKEFGRIAAQTAKHVIRQGIREAERSQQLSEIQSKSHDIVMATVTRVDMSAASWLWIWARAARPSCPAASRCPARLIPRASSCRSTSSTWSAPSVAPAS